MLVGLALRRQDANATRNIPQVVRTTEAVIVSIWKRAWVNKLNTMALIVETLHVANRFFSSTSYLFMFSFLQVTAVFALTD